MVKQKKLGFRRNLSTTSELLILNTQVLDFFFYKMNGDNSTFRQVLSISYGTFTLLQSVTQYLFKELYFIYCRVLVLCIAIL